MRDASNLAVNEFALKLPRLRLPKKIFPALSAICVLVALALIAGPMLIPTPRKVGVWLAGGGILLLHAPLFALAGLVWWQHITAKTAGTLRVFVDGVVVSRRFRRDVVLFRDMHSVAESADGTLSFLTESGGLEVRVANPGQLRAVIEARKDTFDSAHTPALPSLARTGESIATWLERQKGAEQPEYRAQSLTQDILVRVAANPAAERAQRIAAAVRLRNAPTDEKHRVRCAIKDTADETLSAVLEQALSGKLVADDLERMLV